MIAFAFTPFRIENAQSNVTFSFIYAHKVGVLNEKRCKGGVQGEPGFPFLEIQTYRILIALLFSANRFGRRRSFNRHGGFVKII